MGIRGPLGHPWPIEFLEGKNIVVVGGGFAFTTLRSLINYMLLRGEQEALREDHGDLRGARPPACCCYKEELQDWEKRSDIEMMITVDKGDATWKGREGFVPTVCKEVGARARIMR